MSKDSRRITHLDVPNNSGTVGILKNRIVEILDFLKEEDCSSFINYLENNSKIGHASSYEYRNGVIANKDNDLEKFGLPVNFINKVINRIRQSIELEFERSVSLNTINAQKFGPGGYGHPHSDNTDESGNPTHLEINKYSGIIYLNDSYSGGEIYFPDHNLKIRPSSGSLLIFPGGKENIHGVNEILSGDRYSIVSFWDFEDSVYSDDRESWREECMRQFSDSWQKDWESDWKYRWKLWNFI